MREGFLRRDIDCGAEQLLSEGKHTLGFASSWFFTLLDEEPSFEAVD